MERPLIKRAPAGGEYSTVILFGGMIETMWFPDDTSEEAILVGRTSLQALQSQHITDWEDRRAR